MSVVRLRYTESDDPRVDSSGNARVGEGHFVDGRRFDEAGNDRISEAGDVRITEQYAEASTALTASGSVTADAGVFIDGAAALSAVGVSVRRGIAFDRWRDSHLGKRNSCCCGTADNISVVGSVGGWHHYSGW